MRACWMMVLTLLALSACQSTPSVPVLDPATDATSNAVAIPDLAASYRALAGSSAVYAVDAAASTVRIYAFRGGAAARAGHNHVLSPARFEGYVQLPSDDPKQARFDLRVPLAELGVDEPVWRAETGGNFTGVRSPSDIEGTRRNMLGPKGLDAGQFPEVWLRSVSVAGDWPVLAVEVAVTLHGVTRHQWLMLDVEHDDRQLRARGALVLRQSDFGVAPFSVLGGLLAVQDAVAIRFDLVARLMPAG